MAKSIVRLVRWSALIILVSLKLAVLTWLGWVFSSGLAMIGARTDQILVAWLALLIIILSVTHLNKSFIADFYRNRLVPWLRAE